MSSSTSLDRLAPSGARAFIHFQSEDGETPGPVIHVPMEADPEILTELLDALLENDETGRYRFFFNDEPIDGTLAEAGLAVEEETTVVYRREALFRVRPVTHCSATVPGHDGAVLSIALCNNGAVFATGGADGQIIIWNSSSQLPMARHTTEDGSDVLCLAYAPGTQILGIGTLAGGVYLLKEGRLVRLRGHRRYVSDLAWEPYHRGGRRFVTVSKDGTTAVWDSATERRIFQLGGHEACVTCVKWGVSGIYTGSQDMTIRLWSHDGTPIRTLKGHAHWVNHLSLSTDYLLSCMPHVPGLVQRTLSREEAADFFNEQGSEILVSGSDDYTLFWWDAARSSKPMVRKSGHQQPVNCVRFSPDGHYVASASFDKSVRIWDGRTGKHLATLRNHVGAVYRLAWSADSRLLVSCSRDSTLKLWDIRKKSLFNDLPGHTGQVFAVDWLWDGTIVVSGAQDGTIKIWKR